MVKFRDHVKRVENDAKMKKLEAKEKLELDSCRRQWGLKAKNKGKVGPWIHYKKPTKKEEALKTHEQKKKEHRYNVQNCIDV